MFSFTESVMLRRHFSMAAQSGQTKHPNASERVFLIIH